jgi:hypothetical protein
MHSPFIGLDESEHPFELLLPTPLGTADVECIVTVVSVSEPRVAGVTIPLGDALIIKVGT